MRSDSNPRLRLRTDGEGLGMVLGSLELSVMRTIWDWDKQGITNKEIMYAMQGDGPRLTQATIWTTTRRLTEKGYLHETKEQGTYVYTPTMSEDELEAYVVTHILARLRASWPDLVAEQTTCEDCALEYQHHDQ